MPSLLGSEEHTSEPQSPCNLVCRLLFDRKSTRLNSSHLVISYAVFCLKKNNTLAAAGDSASGSPGQAVRLGTQRPRPPAARIAACDQAYMRHVTRCVVFVFFFNDTATTEIYTLSLHDALPI